MLIATQRAPRAARIKRWIASVSGSLLAAITLSAAAAPAVHADASCASGYACVWSSGDFSGTPRSFGAGDAARGWIEFEHLKLSIKNRFTSRPVYAWNGYYRVAACLNPGDQRGAGPFIGATHIAIGDPGTRCLF